MDFQTLFLEREIPYTGEELRPHFLLSQFKLRGPALAAFIGPCEVRTEALVDWEDRLADDFIRARSMVHFLGEFFGFTLKEGVLFQRLFTSIVKEELEGLAQVRLRRDGDDLFWTSPDGKERKLSVSIVTATPVSQLLHFGLNLDSEGAPVAAAGIKDLIARPAESQSFAATLGKRILERSAEEMSSVEWACTKVRPVV